MSKKKIITSIVCAMLVAGVTEAAVFFPAYGQIATAVNTLIAAVLAIVVGKE